MKDCFSSSDAADAAIVAVEDFLFCSIVVKQVADLAEVISHLLVTLDTFFITRLLSRTMVAAHGSNFESIDFVILILIIVAQSAVNPFVAAVGQYLTSALVVRAVVHIRYVSYSTTLRLVYL